MTDKETMRLALDALENTATRSAAEQFVIEQHAIAFLKQALAQPEQEPVGFWVYKPALPKGNLGRVMDGDLPWVYDQDSSSGYSARMFVYTAPPNRLWLRPTVK